jgi:enoyl-CoA hydratase/carnithine racemase
MGGYWAGLAREAVPDDEELAEAAREAEAYFASVPARIEAALGPMADHGRGSAEPWWRRLLAAMARWIGMVVV